MEKILVIEDAHLLRNGILETLSLEGFEVVGAENGMQGLRAAQEHRPDLILCDIMMPELDGYGVLDELRKNPETAMTPFIFMTAKTDKTDIRLGMGLGADDYLTKPFLTTDLLKTIRARLNRREMVNAQVELKLRQLRENIITALPHELRTPLNTIIGFSEMLLLDGLTLDPNKVTEWARFINDAALRLYRLIENYLVYVRIETLARDNEKIQAYKTARTENPTEIIQAQASQKASSFKREADLVLQLENASNVHIPEQYLAKLVDELADNAFKFSTLGAKVEIQTSSKDGAFIITIIDHGRGITPEQIKDIGAYMQFDRWLYEQQGMGLGLEIARRLVELANGSLAIESEPAQHTKVSVKLLQG